MGKQPRLRTRGYGEQKGGKKMGDSEHTRISDFQIVDQWGQFTTLDERRFYRALLLDEKIEYYL